MPGATIHYCVHVPTGVVHMGQEGFQLRFGGSVTTDEDGKYELPNLAPGARWKISFAVSRMQSQSLADVNIFVEGPYELDLGDTKLPTPSGPADLREQVSAQFHFGEPLGERMAAAKGEAQRQGTPILIYLGDPTSDFSWKLKAALDNRANRELFRGSSRLPQVWVRVRNAESATKALGELGLSVKGAAPATIILVDANGRMLEALALRKDADGMIDTAPLLAMLSRHAPAAKESPDGGAAAAPASGAALFTHHDEKGFVAGTFELQVLGSGVNWKESLRIGSEHQKLKATGDVQESKSRVQAAGARLVLDPPGDEDDEGGRGEPKAADAKTPKSKCNLQRTAADATRGRDRPHRA